MSNTANQVELLRKHRSIMQTEPGAYINLETGIGQVLEARRKYAIDYENSFDEEAKKEIGKHVEWCNERLKLMLDIF